MNLTLGSVVPLAMFKLYLLSKSAQAISEEYFFKTRAVINLMMMIRVFDHQNLMKPQLHGFFYNLLFFKISPPSLGDPDNKEILHSNVLRLIPVLHQIWSAERLARRRNGLRTCAAAAKEIF